MAEATLNDVVKILERNNKLLDNVANPKKDRVGGLRGLLQSDKKRDKADKDARFSGAKNAGEGIGAGAGGIGKLLGGLGIGAGVAAGGVGLALMGLATVMEKFDPQVIKDKIDILLSIGEDRGGQVEFLKEGGQFGIAMAGIGIGLALFGFGSATAGVAEAINKFTGNENWAQTIKDNVTTLLTIVDLPGIADGEAKAGKLTLTLTAIGTGLAVFGIGSTLTAIGEGINKFTASEDWPQTIKDNVETLLEIPDLKNATLGNVATFPAIMASIGLGLIAFSAGQVTTGLANIPQAATDALKTFTGEGSTDGDFATAIRDNVKTLLEIPTLKNATFKNVATFPAVMAMIGGGLIAFSFGKVADTVSEGAADAIEKFSTGDNFAERIKKEVTTLLELPSLPGANLKNVTSFATIMGTLGFGLFAFGAGKGVEAAGAGAQEAIAKFSGTEPFAERIKTEITTLASITDLVSAEKATTFVATMAKISTGLVAFGAGDFIAGILAAGKSILKFFVGGDSAFEQIRIIANQSDSLEKGANAIDKIAGSLDKIGNLKFDGTQLGLKEFAKDLAEAIPLIEMSILGTGGKDVSWWPFYGGVQLKGLASPDVGYADAAKNIAGLRIALGEDVDMAAINLADVNVKAVDNSEMSKSEGTRQSLIKSAIVETMIVKNMLSSAQGSGGGTNVSNQDNSIQTNNTTNLAATSGQVQDPFYDLIR
jgi:hypothetical protein